jgi:hypothetical protein
MDVQSVCDRCEGSGEVIEYEDRLSLSGAHSTRSWPRECADCGGCGHRWAWVEVAPVPAPRVAVHVPRLPGRPAPRGAARTLVAMATTQVLAMALMSGAPACAVTVDELDAWALELGAERAAEVCA